MALIQTQVSLLVGANGFAFWHYRTPDLKATIHAANYFNAIASQLNVGDFIAYNAGDATEIASVVSITAGVVVISAGTAVLANPEDFIKAKKAAEKPEPKEDDELDHPDHRRRAPDHDKPGDKPGHTTLGQQRGPDVNHRK